MKMIRPSEQQFQYFAQRTALNHYPVVDARIDYIRESENAAWRDFDKLGLSKTQKLFYLLSGPNTRGLLRD